MNVYFHDVDPVGIGKILEQVMGERTWRGQAFQFDSNGLRFKSSDNNWNSAVPSSSDKTRAYAPDCVWL
jgi:hypothetical protein